MKSRHSKGIVSEIDDSDSDSRNKWNHNNYRGVRVPGLETIPESEPFMGIIQDSGSDSTKKWTHNTSNNDAASFP